MFAAVIRSRRESALIRISERVQRAILRPLPAELGGMAFASHYQSATREAMVGGDLYDITMTQYGPHLDGAVRALVRLLLEHAGDGLADDVLIVLCEPLGQPLAEPPGVI